MKSVFPNPCLAAYTKKKNKEAKSKSESSDSESEEYESVYFPHDKEIHERLERNTEDGKVYQPIDVYRVEMTVFSLGAATLTIFVDWIRDNDSVSLNQVRTWLFLAKFRHKVKDIFKGWILNYDASTVKEASPPEFMHGIVFFFQKFFLSIRFLFLS